MALKNFWKTNRKIWTCVRKIGLAVMTELGRNIHTYLNKGIVGINLTFFWSMVTSSFKLLGARLEKFFFHLKHKTKQIQASFVYFMPTSFLFKL